ncbi:MAG: hypothetical protein ACLGQX_02420, partial [Acidobacteriota bacterium]
MGKTPLEAGIRLPPAAASSLHRPGASRSKPGTSLLCCAYIPDRKAAKFMKLFLFLLLLVLCWPAALLALLLYP